MSQALRNTAASTKRAPRTVAVALPTDVHKLPGVAAVIIADKLVKDFDEAKKKQVAALRPAIEAIFAQDAAKKAKIEDVTRTYLGSDQQVKAQIQLRSKALKKLSTGDAQVLNAVKIPLREVPGRTVINPLYAGDGDAEGAEAVLVAKVIESLTKLIEANPNCGVPADFFIRLGPVNLPVEDALMRALKLPATKRSAPLAILADIAIMRGEIETIIPLVDALNKHIEDIKQGDIKKT